MKIIEYLPPVLAEIREFKILGESEDLQLNNLKSEINSLTNELFVTTAEGVGLDRWEKILNITNSSTDVEFRKFRILSRLNSFGLTLNQRLTSIVGAGNYKIDYYFKEYRLKVSLTLDTKEYEKRSKANVGRSGSGEFDNRLRASVQYTRNIRKIHTRTIK